MKRALQVYLSDEEFVALKRFAAARGWTLSSAVRVALKSLTRAATPEDPLLAASGMVEGLPADLSSRFDEHLLSTFVAERPPTYVAKAQRKRAKNAVRR